MNSKLVLLFIAGLASLTMNAVAHAQESDDPLPSTKSLVATMEDVAQENDAPAKSVALPKTALEEATPSQGGDLTTTRLEDTSEALALDNEVSDADRTAYNESAAQSASETVVLKKEISKLEKQVKSAAAGTERAKKNAALTAKKLEYQKHLQAAAQARLTRQTALQRSQEARLAKIKIKVATADQNLRAKSERTKAVETSLKDLAKEQVALSKRLAKATTKIAQENRKQKLLKEKRARLAQANHKLKSQVTRTESQAATPTRKGS